MRHSFSTWHKIGWLYCGCWSLFVSTLVQSYPLQVPKAVTVFVNNSFVGWLAPGGINTGCVDLFGSQKCLELFWIVKIWQFCHLDHEIIQVSLSFNCFILVVLVHKVFCGDGRDEASWPPMYHGQSQCMELAKPSINRNLSIFVMSLYDISCIFSESGPPGFYSHYP